MTMVISYLKTLVEKHDLITTGGTDWHGNPEKRIGRVSLPPQAIEKFLNKLSFI